MWKLLFLLYTTFSFAQVDVPVKLQDVAEKIKTSNLGTIEGATRVYNSRQQIKFARASLLPKLNIWRLASVIVDWKSAADVITQDLVPFLIPGNWQRKKQAKVFAEATNESFHSLSKNTIFHAKLQYFQLQQDVYQYELQEKLLSEVDKSIDSIAGQIHFKPEVFQWHQELLYQKTLIESDLVNLNQLIWQERQQLSISLGFTSDDVILAEKFVPMKLVFSLPEELSKDSLEASCELKEYDHLIRVSKTVKKEINWNVFGVSDISRGSGGGVFDAIPIQDGLGFGSGASFKIHKSQVELLKKQRDGVVQVLNRQKQNIQKNLKSIEAELAVIKKRTQLIKKELEQAQTQISFGTEISPAYLVTIKQKNVLNDVEQIAGYFKYQVELEKLKRLNGIEDYDFD